MHSRDKAARDKTIFIKMELNSQWRVCSLIRPPTWRDIRWNPSIGTYRLLLYFSTLPKVFNSCMLKLRQAQSHWGPNVLKAKSPFDLWAIVFLVSNIKTYFMDFIGLPNCSYSALVSFCFFFFSRFHFVRGIGDILVCPTLQPSQEFSAKVVKLLAKQGPIYIRAVQDIGSLKVYLDCIWNRV